MINLLQLMCVCVCVGGGYIKYDLKLKKYTLVMHKSYNSQYSECTLYSVFSLSNLLIKFAFREGIQFGFHSDG